MPLGDFDL
jgi:hypothetical protein